MLGRVIEFIKYHNAFSIGFALLFLGFGGVLAANQELKEGIVNTIVSAEEIIKTADNSLIVSIDLNHYTPVIQIIEITEDEKSYYIFYNLETIDLEGGRWSEVTKDKLLTVFKDDLKGRDLGLYAAKQLGGIIDWQLAYLKEVREIEKGKGVTQKVVAITYSGLIGKFLNPREKTFPGYDPVIKPRKKESNQAPENISFVRSIETEINSILPNSEEVTVETTSNAESPQDAPPPSSIKNETASSSADVLEPSNTAISTPDEEILPVATSSPEAAGLDNGEVATSTDEIFNLEDISVDENISTTTQESISEEVLISDEENISIEENTATTTTES